jgi:hypothetical protein
MNTDRNERYDGSAHAVGLPALKCRSSRRVPEEPFETEPWLLLRARHAEGVRLEGHGCIDL